MTDRAQFEAMLEALINEDQESAKEIFHNIVVGKSREIYEELLESDFSKDQGNPYGKDDGEDDGDDSEEGDDGDDSEEDEPSELDDAEDAEDDGDDNEEDDGDDSESDDEDIEDRVMDLEDALEDLKAEFEQLLSGEEHEEENEPGIHGDGMPMHDLEAELGGPEHEEEEEEGIMHHVHHHVNEYVNKVPLPKHGDNGTNTKSTIDNMKNDMGGTTSNIAQSHSETKGGTQGGLASPKAGDLTAGLNVHNRPGSDAGKSAFKKQQPGHGAEKKGHAEGGAVGSVASNKEGGRNTKSLISKRVR
jgi:hypothetical protein